MDTQQLPQPQFNMSLIRDQNWSTLLFHSQVHNMQELVQGGVVYFMMWSNHRLGAIRASGLTLET